MPKQPIKHCHECRHYIAPNPPHEDPLCKVAADNPSLHGFPILHAVKFQRASGFVTDCGPGGAHWEAR